MDEANRPERMDARGAADPALDRHDHDAALSHQLDRLDPSRRAHWPKDDRRSSDRIVDEGQHLTASERGSRWPLG